jgi:hypothetical protein
MKVLAGTGSALVFQTGYMPGRYAVSESHFFEV